MKFIADFHIHSHYSRATSKDMNIVSLTRGAQIKGVNVVGTGDFTHPRWFEEIEEKLEPAEKGLFRLKSKYENEIQEEVPESCKNPMRFMLTVEISTIYKKNDRVRKVHTIIVAPSFEVVRKINSQLQRVGNIHSDGRPILGLDTKLLMKIALEASDQCMVIPAHIWTPHFSVFGSESGFDTLSECFEELTPYIYAVETGLSSDPAMNWRIKELDSRTLISNSDAHSAQKLGREANVFNCEMSYDAIMSALKTNDMKALHGTIEFYPEEGKYHLDGHRMCGVRMSPKETKKNNFLCTKCGKRVTVGVMHRVEVLAEKDRDEGYTPKKTRPFYSIVPLPEIISEVEEVGVSSKRVQGIFTGAIHKLGNEFYILLDAPLKDIEEATSSILAEAVNRMRRKKIFVEGGYDGEFGVVKIFDAKERKEFSGQVGLFG